MFRGYATCQREKYTFYSTDDHGCLVFNPSAIHRKISPLPPNTLQYTRDVFPCQFHNVPAMNVAGWPWRTLDRLSFYINRELINGRHTAFALTVRSHCRFPPCWLWSCSPNRAFSQSPRRRAGGEPSGWCQDPRPRPGGITKKRVCVGVVMVVGGTYPDTWVRPEVSSHMRFTFYLIAFQQQVSHLLHNVS